MLWTLEPIRKLHQAGAGCCWTLSDERRYRKALVSSGLHTMPAPHSAVYLTLNAAMGMPKCGESFTALGEAFTA